MSELSKRLLDDVAAHMEKLEDDLVGVRQINRLMAESMAESQDLIRQYKEELARLRADSVAIAHPLKAKGET